ncbi:hypothetical protein ACEYYH_05105 [Microbacterium trichothecenolyticum]|uniref:hypothetical protein n=1 Tax=Microbacterium trichothecenolyticum TaxID=69370 RepID=UPI0035BE6F7E
MPKPRNRKPFAIPSVPPIAHAGVAGAAHHGAASSYAARVLVRAGALLRPRGDRWVVHRRLVDRSSETPPGRAEAPGDRHVEHASTFHGATARFVALG